MGLEMVYVRSPFAALVVGLMLANPVLAQDAPDWKFCRSDNDLPEARVVADCTELIDAKGLAASDRAKAFYRRGVAYWRRHDANRAITDENEAIKLDGDLADAYLRRGAGYLSNADFKGAIADFTKAIELDPNNLRAYVDRSIARAAEKQTDAALADAKKAIDIDPNFIAGRLALARAYKLTHEYANEFAELNKATETEPKGGFDGYGSRAIAFERKGDYRHAIVDYNRWIEINRRKRRTLRQSRKFAPKERRIRCRNRRCNESHRT